MNNFRYRYVLFALFVLICTAAQSQSIVAERRGEYFHVMAPGMHFLSGKPMEKLQNGSTVTYVITLTVIPENVRKSSIVVRERFAVSYDLWEEKFSIAQSGSGGRSISRLTAPAAEAWCLENISVPLRSIPERRSFMLRIECLAEQNKPNREGENHSTLTLAGLIDVFSRKDNDEPFRMETVAGPFRIEDLKK